MQKFSLYIACFFILALMGCGDTSGDPTAQITKLEALPADVAPGSSTVITATVVKAVGKSADATAEATVTAPGWGENVTFKLLTANGGQLSSLIQKTDGKGEAKTVFTAGNNYNNDTIQATLDNGMSATVVIKKTGSLAGVVISSFVASPTTVAEGQTAVITAKVTDGSNTNPMLGEPVTFTMATNESGACFINSANACVGSVTVNSNAFGNAVAIYRAGGGRPTEEVYDTVRGALANGSSNALIITRSASTPLSIAIAASPTSVSAGQVSIVTATVTGTNNAGVTVFFTLPVNNSGATLSASSVTTDGSGKAVVYYIAGGNNPSQDVSDTIQVAVGNISNFVTITRTGAATTYYSIGVSATPSTLTSDTSNSVILVSILDNLGRPISGVTVGFTVNGPAVHGTVFPSSSVTNGSGNAIATFTGNGALVGGIPTRAFGDTDVVTASATISGVEYTDSVVIAYP